MEGKIYNLLLSGIEEKHYSGAVWLVFKKRQIVEMGSCGLSSIIPEREEMKDNTIFDLASLTKPLITAPITLKSLSRGIIHLEEPILKMQALPFATPVCEASIYNLLTHTSGLKAWYPCYADRKDVLRGTAIIGMGGNIIYEKVPKVIDQYAMKIASLPLEAKVGEKVIYSCLGYILLSYILQVKLKIGYKDEAERLLLNPLGLKRTFFKVPKELIKETAAGEDSNKFERFKVKDMKIEFNEWRNGIIRGEVNDCNAYYANSGTGNAGLFADIFDTLKLAQIFLPESKFFNKDEMRLIYNDLTSASGEHRTIAWRRADSKNDPAHGILPNETLSHTGFTGVGIWIDPVNSEIYILFMNRLHPRRVEFSIDDIRSKFLDIAKEI
ncbi:MAG: serine hydrolase [Acidobacteria bacterium]|nr:serine hydrolase [Acidobacteriota bacterium]